MAWFDRFLPHRFRADKPKGERLQSFVGPASEFPHYPWAGSGVLADTFSLYPDEIKGIYGFGNNNSGFDLPYLRALSRRLVHEHPYARRFLDLMARNVIGAEIFLPDFSDKITEGNADLVAKVRMEWEKFWESRADERGLAGIDAERWAYESYLIDGEAFVRFKIRARKFKLLHTNGESIAYQTSGMGSGGESMHQGIFLDENGRPVAFAFRDWRDGMTAGRIKGERWPEELVLHAAHRSPNNFYRGEPLITASITRLISLKVLDRSVLALLHRQSRIPHVLTHTPRAPSQFGAGAAGFGITRGTDATGGDVDNATLGKEVGAIKIEEASLISLEPGKTLETPRLENPAGDFVQFRAQVVLDAITGLGISRQALTGDYSTGNYSSARQGAVSDREFFIEHQRIWHRVYRTPIFSRWLEWKIRRGDIKAKPDEIEELMRPNWPGPRWNWVDPKAEIAAQVEALKMGITSPQIVIAQSGLKPEKIISDWHDWEKMVKGITALQPQVAPQAQNEGPPPKEPNAKPPAKPQK